MRACTDNDSTSHIQAATTEDGLRRDNTLIHKILIANRGEIAVRIIRACAEANITSVAIYADADRHALHVRKADEAYNIGPESIAGYLNAHRIVNLAVATGWHTMEQLAACQPDALFDDSSDTQRVLSAMGAERTGAASPTSGDAAEL